MKKIILSLMVAIAIGGVACQSNKGGKEINPNSSNEVTFTSNINKHITKASESAFDEGESISVYATDANGDSYAQNIKYTCKSGVFSSMNPIEKEDSEVELAYLAIYPYASDKPTEFNINADQSSSENFTNSDLMSATTELSAEKSVKLSFNHNLSKVEVNLTSEDVDLSDAEITIYSPTTVACDFEAQTFAGTGDKTAVLSKAVGGDSFEAIVAPQTIAAGELFMQVRVDRMDYTWKLDSSVELESGYKYVCDVTIEHTNIIFSGDIEPWVSGGDVTTDYDGATEFDNLTATVKRVTDLDIEIEVEKHYYYGNYYVALTKTADYSGDPEAYAEGVISDAKEAGVDFAEVDNLYIFSETDPISLDTAWEIETAVEYTIIIFGIDDKGEIITNVVELNTKTDSGPLVPEGIDFGSITTSGITSNTYTYTINPINMDNRYITRYCDRATYDSYEDIDELVLADMDYYQYVADSYGYDIALILPMFMFTGEQTFTVRNLESATDYVCYAYEFDPTTMKPTTSVEIAFVRTN